MWEVCKKSFINSLGALIYIVLVALLMQNAPRIFGQMTGVIGPVAFLLLFTLSALAVGSLILLKPIMLYLDGKKKSGVLMLVSSVGWMLLFTIISLIIAAVR